MNYNEIVKIIVYKIDLGIEDEIRMDILSRNGKTVVISENDTDFDNHIAEFQKVAGFDTGWFSKVSQPPFSTCETEIFNRS